MAPFEAAPNGSIAETTAETASILAASLAVVVGAMTRTLLSGAASDLGTKNPRHYPGSRINRKVSVVAMV